MWVASHRRVAFGVLSHFKPVLRHNARFVIIDDAQHPGSGPPRPAWRRFGSQRKKRTPPTYASSTGNTESQSTSLSPLDTHGRSSPAASANALASHCLARSSTIIGPKQHSNPSCAGRTKSYGRAPPSLVTSSLVTASIRSPISGQEMKSGQPVDAWLKSTTRMRSLPGAESPHCRLPSLLLSFLPPLRSRCVLNGAGLEEQACIRRVCSRR